MRPYSVRRDGSLELRLSTIEAQAIHRVADDILSSLDEPDHQDLQRLFPPAYADDREQQAEFAEMTHDALLTAKREAARAVAASIDAGKSKSGRWTGVLDRSTVHSWVGVLIDARLILGTRLDVSEEMEHTPLPADDPQAGAFNLYLYLGGMQELLVGFLLEYDTVEEGT